MSENLLKTSSKSEVYEKNLRLFRQEIDKLNKKLEKNIQDNLTKVSTQAESFMTKLSKNFEDK
jgi:hypothetical protein